MNILVFGNTGQVGKELSRFKETTCIGRDICDLKNWNDCYNYIIKQSPDAVINAAAYTAVDLAEKEELEAIKVNGFSPYYMAIACKELNIPFIHISTDYVFNGLKKTPYLEKDATFPINAYGRSKLLGESAIREVGGSYVILRTSWVFADSGKNFVSTIYSLTNKNSNLRVVRDQFGGPTHAADIAKVCIEICDQLIKDNTKSGTYHFSGMPYVSWAKFAERIVSFSNNKVSIEGVSSESYQSPTLRPLNSMLDCKLIETVFGIMPSDWNKHISRMLKP